MTDPFEGRTLPKGVVIAFGVFLGSLIILLALARIFGFHLEQAPLAPVVQVFPVRFVEISDGSLEVRLVATDRLLRTLPPGNEGFIRGVLRSVERQRKGYNMDLSTPLLLARRADGDVTLEDPVTGILLDLKAFGLTNKDAFAQLLPASSGVP